MLVIAAGRCLAQDPAAVVIPGDGSPGPAPAVTAAAAVEVVARDRGRPYAESLVHVIGVGGVHQPKVWRVLARDPYRPGAIRDFTVDSGRVVSDQFVPPAYHERVPGAVIPPAEIRYDSDAVFGLADRAARTAGVGFDTLDYEIRVLGSGAEGVSLWLVRLNDKDGRTVGELAMRSLDGVVIRQEWFPQGKGTLDGRYATTTDAGIAPSSSPGGTSGADVPEILASGMSAARVGIERGGQAVRTSLQRAGGSVRRFLGSLFGDTNASPAASQPMGPENQAIAVEQPVVVPVAAPVSPTRYH